MKPGQPDSPASPASAAPPAAIAPHPARVGAAWPGVAGVVAVAFGARLLHLLDAQRIPFFRYLVADSQAYDDWARAIRETGWWGSEPFYQAPLYPYFLALVQTLLGDDPWSVRLVQILLGSLACGFLYLAAGALFGRVAGLIAGLGLALYPPAIFFDGLIQKSVLDGVLLTLWLWLLGRFLQAPRDREAALLGAVLGLLILTRENALLFAPVLFTWLWLHFRKWVWPTRARWMGLALLGLAAVLGPVGLRNWSVGGGFLLTTYQGGTNFYIGNNPRADGTYAPLRPGRANTPFERQDATDVAEQLAGRKLRPGEISSFWFRRAFDFIRTHPSAWLALMQRKLAWTVNAYEFPDTEDLYFYQKFARLIATIGPVWHFGVLAPLALGAVVLTAGRWRELWLLYVLVLTVIIGVALFYVFARYRYPLVPILLLLAAGGVVRIPAALRGGQVGLVIFAGVVGLLGARVVNQPVDYPRQGQIATNHANAGIALLQHQRDAEAVAHFEAALQIAPRLFEAHYGLGKARALAGRLSEARGSLETALSLAPNVNYIHGTLGAVLLNQGDLAQAEVHLRKALEIGPVEADVSHNLGLVLLHQQRWREALDALRRSTALAPAQGDFAIALAWALATIPDDELRNGPEALALAEALERAGGRGPKLLDAQAAALAAVGRFADAAATGRRAVQLAQALGDAALAEQIGARCVLYERQEPYRLGW